MKPTPAELIRALIRVELPARLAGDGFRLQRETLYRQAADGLDLIAIERSRWNRSDYGMFRVIFGRHFPSAKKALSIPRFVAWTHSDIMAWPEADDDQRYGFYGVVSTSDPAAIADEVTAIIRDQAPAWFARYPRPL